MAQMLLLPNVKQPAEIHSSSPPISFAISLFPFAKKSVSLLISPLCLPNRITAFKHGQFFLPLTFSVYSPSAIVSLIFIFISNILRFLCSVVHIPRSIYLYFHFRIYYIPLPNGYIYHTAKLAFCRQLGINIDSRLEGRGAVFASHTRPFPLRHKSTNALQQRHAELLI